MAAPEPDEEAGPPSGTRLWRFGFTAILLLATVVRLAYLAELRATPWFERLVVDPEYYDQWARRIAAGDWLGSGAFYMDPLYPYVLGALYAAAGRDLLLARLLNVGCSVGACALTAVLGRRVGGPAVGLLAGLGLALYEPDVFAVGELDKTSLSMLLVAAFLLLMTGRGLHTRIAAGFVLGLGALTRANLLLFAPLGALAIVEDPAERGRAAGMLPRGIVAAVMFLAGFALALAPVTWRNHHVSGEWVLTTTQLGQNFYTGNNPENPYGAYGVVSFVRANPHFEERDFRAAAEARAGRPLGTSEVSAFWLRVALAHIVEAPGFAARAFARKAVLFWNDFEISDSQDQYLMERESRMLSGPLLGFGEIAGFAVLGFAVHARRRRPVRLLGAYVILYGAGLVAFFVFARYRIQTVPALMPLAGLGAVELAARVRARGPKRLAAAVLVVGVAAWASFQTVGLFSPDHPNVVEMRLRRYADVYASAGDPDRAIAALKEAIPGCTHGCPWALADLFALYRSTGRTAEGIRYFEEFVRRYPAQRDAPEYLVQLRAATELR
jgi:4-amino-4-deoxy-L-arabinose transferase-like glycosyltransferase